MVHRDVPQKSDFRTRGHPFWTQGTSLKSPIFGHRDTPSNQNSARDQISSGVFLFGDTPPKAKNHHFFSFWGHSSKSENSSLFFLLGTLLQKQKIITFFPFGDTLPKAKISHFFSFWGHSSKSKKSSLFLFLGTLFQKQKSFTFSLFGDTLPKAKNHHFFSF